MSENLEESVRFYGGPLHGTMMRLSVTRLTRAVQDTRSVSYFNAPDGEVVPYRVNVVRGQWVAYTLDRRPEKVGVQGFISDVELEAMNTIQAVQTTARQMERMLSSLYQQVGDTLVPNTQQLEFDHDAGRNAYATRVSVHVVKEMP